MERPCQDATAYERVRSLVLDMLHKAQEAAAGSGLTPELLNEYARAAFPNGLNMVTLQQLLAAERFEEAAALVRADVEEDARAKVGWLWVGWAMRV